MRLLKAFPRVAMFRALAHRPFALLLLGRTLSQLGDIIYAIAIAWWVLESTGSARAMGTVLIFATVPRLMLLLVGGVAVDRVSRYRLMIGSDLIRAALVGIVALLVWWDALQLWHLYGLSAAIGVVSAFFTPAVSSVIPDILPADALPSANSLRVLAVRLSGILGPAIAGLLIARNGTGLAFAIDAVSFLIAAACVRSLAHVASVHRTVAANSSLLADLREGFETVRGSPWLWLTIVIAAVSNIALEGPMGTALPLLVEQHYGEDVGVYSLFRSASAVGAVLAAIILGRMLLLRRRGVLVYGSWMLAALTVVAIGLLVPSEVAAGALVVFGAAEAVLGLAWVNSLQDAAIVPRDRLGRVLSIDEFGSAALVPLGYGVAGIATDRFGAAPVFVVGGLIGVTVIGAGLLHPTVRSLD